MKISQRMKHLPIKKNISVLNCYAGKNKIWNTIQNRYSGNIKITGIDIEQKYHGQDFKADNSKILPHLDLSKYDVIDLDAYGVCYKPLKIVFEKKYSGVCFVTFIQSMYGGLPLSMLQELGYTPAMIKKCPSLFNKNGFKKYLAWLYQNGINEVYECSLGENKHYLFFEITP